MNKQILFKSSSHTLLLNEHGVLILIWHKIGNVATRPLIDEHDPFTIRSRSGIKTVPAKVRALINKMRGKS